MIKLHLWAQPICDKDFILLEPKFSVLIKSFGNSWEIIMQNEIHWNIVLKT